MRLGRLRLAGAVLVLFTAMSLPVAGCGVVVELADRSVPRAPISTPSPTATPLSPAEKLADAAAKTNTGVTAVAMRAPGMTTEAWLDPDGRKATKSIVIGDDDVDLLRVELIQIDNDLYFRAPDLPGASRKWMRRDIADLPVGSPLRLLPESDHTGAADLVNCVVTVKRHGGLDFTGTMDLTRSRTVDRKILTELGAKATAVPFTARASAGGPLFGITLHLPSVLPTIGKVEYGYSSVDVLDVQRPPASEVTEPPQSVIDRLDV